MTSPLTKKSIRTSVLLPEDIYSRIQSLAVLNNVSSAWLMRAAVLKFLDEYDGQQQLPLELARTKRDIER